MRISTLGKTWTPLIVLLMIACGDSPSAPSQVESFLARSGNAVLGESIFEADCASCHATKDGFDLAFFSFTDTTIVRRALGHVDLRAATHLVAYIRSLEVEPIAEESRPFQPGGVMMGGDVDFAIELFGRDDWPDDLSTEDLRAIDPRRTPVAIEFPTWSDEESNLDWMPDIGLAESLLHYNGRRARQRLNHYYRTGSLRDLGAAIDAIRDADQDPENAEAPCVMEPISRLRARQCFEARRWASSLGAQYMLRYGLDEHLDGEIHDAWWHTGNIARRTVQRREVRGQIDNGLDNWVTWMWMGWAFEPHRHSSVYLALGLERQGLDRHATFHVLRAQVARSRGSSSVYRDARNVARFAPSGWLPEAMEFSFNHLLERLDGGEIQEGERLIEAIAEVERAYRDAAERLSDAEAAELLLLRDQVLARLH